MSDEKALLAAIWEHPHEDTPRLVYADWLQENELHERVRFIRLQCDIARRDDDDPQLPELKKRESGLWTANRKLYRAGLPDRLRGFAFHRGFVSPVLQRMTTHKFFRDYLPLLPEAPLWGIEVHSAAPSDIFEDERFRRVGSFKQSGMNWRINNLLTSPNKLNLTNLAWPSGFADPDDMKVLCAPGAMPHLTRLNLNSSRIGDEGLAILAQSRMATNLTSLALQSNKIGVVGVRAMVESGNFNRLQHLDLGYDRPGDVIVLALTSRNAFPALRHLCLFCMGLKNSDLEAIAAWPGASSLRHLQLHGDVTIRASGIRALAASPYLRELQTLDLYPWQVQRAEIAAILTEWLGSAADMPNFRHGLRGSRVVRQ